MSAETHKHGDPGMNGGYERQDLGVPAVVYFLVGLVVVTGLIVFALRGLYSYLDAREKAQQLPVSPLVTKAPGNTRDITKGYPQSVFPSPKLEEDERGQLNSIRLSEEQTLNSYGWVDQKAGTVRIPIERAMELTASRLPVRGQGSTGETSTARNESNKGKKQ